jgi:hypothetical protein
MNIENPYESDELLQQYLVFHYANAEEQFPLPFWGSGCFRFPQALRAGGGRSFQIGGRRPSA